MDYDLIVIGAGAGGEAAGTLGAELGARVAVVEKDLVGGICSFWACMPSKSLLDSAHRRALGADYSWKRASDRRDWMISRENIEYPDDSSHVQGLEKAGAEVLRGSAAILGPGKVEVRSNGRPRSLEGGNLVVAVGSQPMIPPIEGLEEAGYWTSNVGTSLRDLPSSMVVLGGGAVGVELAQVYGRFGVETVLVESHTRILPRDHPKSSEAVQDQLREEGVDLRLGVQAELVSKGGRGRRVKLSDGSVVEGAEVLVAVGRRPMDLREMGIEEAGVKVDDHGVASPDDQMRASARVFVAGDAAGGMQFTHVADYQGRIAAKAALGKPARADLRSVPRATYTYPETGAVGFTVEEAQEQGIDAFEVTQDFTTTARGYSIEGSRGHVTAVVDRERKTLAGVFAACPAASELFHEGVLAIKHSIPVEVLADTLHAFPTGARVFGNLMTEALKRL